MFQVNHGLIKPEYFFRPQQLFNRLIRGGKPTQPDFRLLRLPWGHQLEVGIHDTIGFAIWHLGVYELVVSEVLWRLIDPKESVADVGANFGYMTSLMAFRTGEGGEVTAFEPHPKIFQSLEGNVKRWNHPHVLNQKITLVPKALSEEAGNATLYLPSGFSENGGTAFIQSQNSKTEGLESIIVPVTRFDEVFKSSTSAPGVVKIDVEGNEYQVLKGAGRLLTDKTIRDIVFEDHGVFPTPTMSLLMECGYTLFRLKKGFFGPLLLDPSQHLDASTWEPTNYLATTLPDRAIARLKIRGWKCLG